MQSFRYLVCVSSLTFSSLSLAMERPAPSKLLSLRELAAQQVAKAYPENKSQITGHNVPQDCKAAIARQLLLAGQHQELCPIEQGQDHLYVLKKDQISEESYYKDVPHHKPSKHPENPFVGSKGIQKKFRFPYEYTKTKKQGLLQYFVDSVEGKQLIMNGFQPGISRLCAGPNKNNMFVYAEKNRMYICELKPGRAEVCIWNSISHKTYETKEEDPITALEACLTENIFFGGTKSGKVYSYERILVNRVCKEYRWAPFEVFICLKDPIDDMQLSHCGEFLWILSGHHLCSYNLKTHKREHHCNLTDLPFCVLKGEEGERMNVFTMSPDNKYALIGGTRGTIIIADLVTDQSYLLEEESGSGIYQLWWTAQDVPHPVVALKNDGMLIALKLAIAKAETYFE